MKTRFHVGPSWWRYSDIIQESVIEADYAGDAASMYVTQNHDRLLVLDNQDRIMVKTVQYNEENEAIIRQFEVVRVPAFQTMREFPVKVEG